VEERERGETKTVIVLKENLTVPSEEEDRQKKEEENKRTHEELQKRFQDRKRRGSVLPTEDVTSLPPLATIQGTAKDEALRKEEEKQKARELELQKLQEDQKQEELKKKQEEENLKGFIT
jgi:hypothetical protein